MHTPLYFCHFVLGLTIPCGALGDSRHHLFSSAFVASAVILTLYTPSTQTSRFPRGTAFRKFFMLYNEENNSSCAISMRGYPAAAKLGNSSLVVLDTTRPSRFLLSIPSPSMYDVRQFDRLVCTRCFPSTRRLSRPTSTQIFNTSLLIIVYFITVG